MYPREAIESSMLSRGDGTRAEGPKWFVERHARPRPGLAWHLGCEPTTAVGEAAACALCRTATCDSHATPVKGHGVSNPLEVR